MVSLNQQLLVFSMACVLGGALGFVYDFFRITRIAIKTCKAVVFIEDIIFFAIATIASFTFIMLENAGVFRGLLIIGEILGAVIYFYSISIVLIKSAHLIIRFIKFILKFIYNIFFKPIVVILMWIKQKIDIKMMQIKLQRLLDYIKVDP